MPTKLMPKFIPDNCVGCEACVSSCPESCLQMNDNNVAEMANASACTSCSTCESVCPSEAIVMTELEY